MRDAMQSRLAMGGVQKPPPPVIALIGKWLTDNPVRRADLPQNIAALGIDHQEQTVLVPSKVTPQSIARAPLQIVASPVRQTIDPVGRGLEAGNSASSGGNGHFFGAQTKVARAGNKTGQ